MELTDLVAFAMPLISVTSSGTARMSRTMRVSRRSRRSRSMDIWLRLEPPASPLERDSMYL